jgi:hypothetical protein
MDSARLLRGQGIRRRFFDTPKRVAVGVRKDLGPAGYLQATLFFV